MEKKKHIYRVEFTIKQHGFVYSGAIDLEAENAESAKKSARAMWQGRYMVLREKPPHMFNMTARRRDAEGIEYDWFRAIGGFRP